MDRRDFLSAFMKVVPVGLAVAIPAARAAVFNGSSEIVVKYVMHPLKERIDTRAWEEWDDELGFETMEYDDIPMVIMVPDHSLTVSGRGYLKDVLKEMEQRQQCRARTEWRLTSCQIVA